MQFLSFQVLGQPVGGPPRALTLGFGFARQPEVGRVRALKLGRTKS